MESKWIFAPLQGMNLRIKTIETILLRTARFEQVLFTTVDPDGDADLFETDETIEPSDAIAVLLDRLHVRRQASERQDRVTNRSCVRILYQVICPV
jgi:hypothetical protein